jgi:uncharacterized protein YjiS (DUF1127 family)
VQYEIDPGTSCPAFNNRTHPKETDHGSRHQSGPDAHYVEAPGAFAHLRQSFAANREYLATCEQLSALSDRQLADMGISRLGIREIARASVSER